MPSFYTTLPFIWEIVVEGTCMSVVNLYLPTLSSMFVTLMYCMCIYKSATCIYIRSTTPSHSPPPPLLPSPLPARDGSAVELVGLSYSAVAWLYKLFQQGQYPYQGVTLPTDHPHSTYIYIYTRMYAHVDCMHTQQGIGE